MDRRKCNTSRVYAFGRANPYEFPHQDHGLISAVVLGCFPRLLHAAGSDVDEAIRKVRMGTLVIEAAPGVEVRVEQLRHEFWFGAALASQMFGGRMNAEDAAQYKKVFLENFNAAVTENALKWHAMEPRQGEVDYSIVDAILQWTDQHEIPLRGHNIFWGIPNCVQPWLKAMDDATLRETLKARALDIGKRYRGRFAEYDLNNEMIHGNYYEDRLGPDITRDMASWVRQEDPNAVLFLNDYDILTGRRLDDYVAHIRKFLDQGVPIGGIGVQGHLHGDSFDPVALRKLAGPAGRVQAAHPRHRVQFPRPAVQVLRQARRAPLRRGGAGQSQGHRGLLPHLLRPAGGGRHPDVGILGGGQLDSRILAVPPGLVPDAGRRGLPRPGVQAVVDDLARADRCPGPVRGPRLLRPAPRHRRRQGDGRQPEAVGADEVGFVQAAVAHGQVAMWTSQSHEAMRLWSTRLKSQLQSGVFRVRVPRVLSRNP